MLYIICVRARRSAFYLGSEPAPQPALQEEENIRLTTRQTVEVETLMLALSDIGRD